jgi:hypothetical protein
MAKDAKFGRTFLYHKTQPLGKIFDDKKDHDEALKAGWTTAPYTINDSISKQSPPPWEEESVKSINKNTEENLDDFLAKLTNEEVVDSSGKKRGRPKRTFD